MVKLITGTLINIIEAINQQNTINTIKNRHIIMFKGEQAIGFQINKWKNTMNWIKPTGMLKIRMAGKIKMYHHNDRSFGIVLSILPIILYI